MTNMTEVAMRVAEVMQVSVGEILARSRIKSAMDARKVLYCALRMMGRSTTEIEIFCGKSHSTVARVANYSKPEITEKALNILQSMNIPAYDMKTAYYKSRRKKYKSTRKPIFKKVPDYKNNCIRVVEVL